MSVRTVFDAFDQKRLLLVDYPTTAYAACYLGSRKYSAVAVIVIQ